MRVPIATSFHIVSDGGTTPARDLKVSEGGFGA
jgi:hypothetical protein